MLHFRLLISFILLLFIGQALLAQKTKKDPWNYLSETKTPEEILQIENKLQRLYYIIAGEFTNKIEDNSDKKDGIANDKILHQNFIAIPIWQDRTDEYWLHWGWYKHDEPERPLLQGIWQVNRLNRDSFQIIYFQLPNEEANDYYSLEWTKKNPFANLKPKDLSTATSKSYILVEREDNIFQILPSETPQAYDISDKVKFISLDVTYDVNKQVHATRFLDENQQLVFGFGDKNNVPVFTRRNKNTPYYIDLNIKKKKK